VRTKNLPGQRQVIPEAYSQRVNCYLSGVLP
jgi:hypothetical protein